MVKEYILVTAWDVLTLPCLLVDTRFNPADDYTVSAAHVSAVCTPQDFNMQIKSRDSCGHCETLILCSVTVSNSDSDDVLIYKNICVFHNLWPCFNLPAEMH